MAVTTKRLYKVYQKMRATDFRSAETYKRAGAYGLGFAEEKGRQGLSAANQKRIEKGITFGPIGTLKLLGKMAGKASGLMGINFSIGSLLKQSQLFTGILGTIFQILGAMVDAFLAPLMPYFVKLIRRMVTWIPWAQEKGEQFANWIQKLLSNSEGPVSFIMRFLKEGFLNSVREVFTTIIPIVAQEIAKAMKGVGDYNVLGSNEGSKRGLSIKELGITAGIVGTGVLLAPLTGGASLGVALPAAAGYASSAALLPGTNKVGDSATNKEMAMSNFANVNTQDVSTINEQMAMEEISLYNAR